MYEYISQKITQKVGSLPSSECLTPHKEQWMTGAALFSCGSPFPKRISEAKTPPTIRCFFFYEVCVCVGWEKKKEKRERERKKKKTQKTLSHLFIFYPIYLSKLHYTMLNKDTIFLHNFLQNPWLITAPSLTNTRTIIFFFFGHHLFIICTLLKWEFFAYLSFPYWCHVDWNKFWCSKL